MLSDATLRYAEELTTALLGADALYAREQEGKLPPAEPGSTEAAGALWAGRERLIVLNMSQTHQPEPFADYAEARERFIELHERAATLPEPDRRRYYAQCCHSTIAFTRWREGALPFTGQIKDFLHVPAAPAGGGTVDALREEMRDLLNAMGYSGDLADQFAAWEARHRVPPDAVEGVLNELMDEAWERTTARMPMPAPKSDGMRVVTETGAPYNARCDYLNRTVHLNIDPVLTRPALKHLAVHECYPGHYLQFKLRETWYRDGTAPADGLLSVVNTASSCTFEGIADNGMAVLDWLDSDDDRLSALMTQYRAAIVTKAAWRLHALRWGATETEEWLRSQTLVGGEGWVANRMRFIAAPHRCALIWSYWYGEQSVAPIWHRTPQNRRSDFLRFLFGRMHSPQSVALFIA
jgi:hypothetical protein